MEAVADGHCGLPEDQLLTQAEKLLEIPRPPLAEALSREAADGLVVATRRPRRHCWSGSATTTYSTSKSRPHENFCARKPFAILMPHICAAQAGQSISHFPSHGAASFVLTGDCCCLLPNAGVDQSRV
jgi:hypothetical protein